jgi:DNA-binding transcriptional regulator GbsR (MarR family)
VPDALSATPDARPDGRRAVDPELLAYVEDVASWFEGNGLPRGAGRVLGWLLVCDPPEQSSDDLATVLQASAGAISTNTRLLVTAGLVERTGVPGDRRAYHRIRPDAWSGLVDAQQQQVAALTRVARRGLELLDDRPEERRARVAALADLAEFWQEQYPTLIAAWRERHHRAGGGTEERG